MVLSVSLPSDCPFACFSVCCRYLLFIRLWAPWRQRLCLVLIKGNAVQGPSATRRGWSHLEIPHPGVVGSSRVWCGCRASPSSAGGHWGWGPPVVAPLLAKHGHCQPCLDAWSSQASTPFCGPASSASSSGPCSRDPPPVSSPDHGRASVPGSGLFWGRPQPSPVSGLIWV